MKNNKTAFERERFSTGLAVFFATLSSTVGLGNIWKFPYLTGKYGGGAFLIIYFLCVIFVALPVMISEMFIGRRTRKNAIGAIKALTKKPFWKVIGYMGIVSAFFILFFYSAVAGWVYSYIFKAISGLFKNATMDSVESIFGQTVTGPLPPILWQIAAIAVVSTILLFGVKKGIEGITKLLMPLLLILIIICDIRALLLPGAMEGIRFLFNVNFSSVTKEVVLMALGLSFFKLSLGMGTIITYGSYFTSDNNMFATSGKVALADTIVSLLAGLAVFPAVFSFGMKPEQGPGLLFMTIPLVFSKIPFGGLLVILFFILTAIAATTAMMSIFEVVIIFITEEQRLSRKKAVIITAFIVMVFGIPSSLSANSTSLLGNVKILGLTFFNFFDSVSSNILLPLGGLLIVIFVGYFLNRRDVARELSNKGTVNNGALIKVYLFLLKFITPILLLIVFLSMIGAI